MSGFCRILLSTGRFLDACPSDFLVSLENAAAAAGTGASPLVRSVSLQTAPDGWSICGATETIEALLVHLRPTLPDLGIELVEKLWARDDAFTDLVGRLDLRQRNAYTAPSVWALEFSGTHAIH